MEIIPAIDLLNGKCVRLNQGNYNEVTKFNSDPVKQAQTWERQGAKRLHLVDLDGAKTGEPVNDLTIKEIKKSITIPIQLGGGIRSIDRAKELFGIGIDIIILGTIAIENQELVKDLSKEYEEKIDQAQQLVNMAFLSGVEKLIILRGKSVDKVVETIKSKLIPLLTNNVENSEYR